MSKLTAAKLRTILDYYPETGDFFWKVARKGRRLDERAGTITKFNRGLIYRQLCIDYRLYRAHRLAFLWMTGEWPAEDVDHINGDGLDNRWCNLRAATRQQNSFNSTQRMKKKRNTPKGVVWVARDKVYRAQIKVDYKPMTLGYFKTLEEAHAAYLTAAKKHFGEYVRT